MNSSKTANREETLLIRLVLALHELGPGAELSSAQMKSRLGISSAYVTKVATHLEELGLVTRQWGKVTETGWIRGDEQSRYRRSVSRREPNRPAVARYVVDELLGDDRVVCVDSGNTARLVMVALAGMDRDRTILTANLSPVTDLRASGKRVSERVSFEFLGGLYQRGDHMVGEGLAVDPVDSLRRARANVHIDSSIVVPGSATVLGGGIDLWTERPGEVALRTELLQTGRCLQVLLGGPERLLRKGRKFARLGPDGIRGFSDITFVCSGGCRSAEDIERTAQFVSDAKAAGATVHLIDPKTGKRSDSPRLLPKEAKE